MAEEELADAEAAPVEPDSSRTMEHPVVVAGKEKGKKNKKEKGVEVLADGPSIAGHPRAVRSVARAKAWGALIGFVLGGYLSLPTHTPADAGLRALIAGAALYVGAWGVSVFVWRRLVFLEIRAREQQAITGAEAIRSGQGTSAQAVAGRGRQGASAN